MIDWWIIKKLVVALALGGLIGIERERSLVDDAHLSVSFGGIRTFALFSLFGFMSAYLATIFGNVFLYVSMIALVLIVVVTHTMIGMKKRVARNNIAIVAIMTYLMGVVIFIGNDVLAVILALLLSGMLLLKPYLHKFAHGVTKDEMYDIIKFIFITFVLLPFLPDKGYGPFNALNPHIIWLMVVFISGISFVAYMIMKVIGTRKGIAVSALLGGIVSSTATTMSFAAKSKLRSMKHEIGPLTFGVLLASSVMVLRIIFIVFILDKELFLILLVPFLAMSATGFLVAFAFYKHQHSNFGMDVTKHDDNEVEYDSPFTLGPALKFAAIFAVILLVTKAAAYYFGNSGIYFASFFAGFADVDATVLSMIELLKSSEIVRNAASIAIIIAVVVNTLVKSLYIYIFGDKNFAKQVFEGIIAMAVVGVISLLFFI